MTWLVTKSWLAKRAVIAARETRPKTNEFDWLEGWKASMEAPPKNKRI
jgi:hypothetical protein